MSNEETTEVPAAVERTACDVFVAPATCFGSGVPLDMVMTAIRDRANMPEAPFKLNNLNRLVSPTPDRIDAAIDEALKRYPHAEDAIVFLSVAIGHRVGRITPADVAWAKQETLALTNKDA